MDPDAIKRSLAGSGLRSTPQRYAVMAFFDGQARHPTAQRSSKLLTASIHALPELRFITICATWCRLVWSVK